MENRSLSVGQWIALLCALAVLLFTIRITGPSDLEGYAQHRNIGYVMDMMWQGSWLAQYDIQNRILSKPPLHTWLTAPFAAVFGVDRLALALPSLLAVLGLALLVFEVGRRRFGLLAGGLAGVAILLAPTMSKHIALVRSDPLFALLIAGAAFTAFYAWERGKGWTLFWVLCGLATLTKGPLGIILAAAGLLAWFWERRSDPATPVPRGNHLPGLVLYVAMTAGWFLLAWRHYGDPFIDKLIFDELLGQATGARKDSFPGQNLPKPTLFLLARFLPFSLFFFYALWRVFRSPASDAGERRFERFLALWVITGLVIFSLAAHHRADLLLPLWPACALLAGREMARLAGRWGMPKFSRIAGVVGVLLIATVVLTYHATWGKRAERSDNAENVRAAAMALAESGIDPHSLHHIDTPVTLQMYLGTYRPWLSRDEVQALLESDAEAVLLVVDSAAPEDFDIAARARVAEAVFVWTAEGEDAPLVTVYRLTRSVVPTVE